MMAVVTLLSHIGLESQPLLYQMREKPKVPLVPAFLVCSPSCFKSNGPSSNEFGDLAEVWIRCYQGHLFVISFMISRIVQRRSVN